LESVQWLLACSDWRIGGLAHALPFCKSRILPPFRANPRRGKGTTQKRRAWLRSSVLRAHAAIAGALDEPTGAGAPNSSMPHAFMLRSKSFFALASSFTSSLGSFLYAPVRSVAL